MNRTDFWLVTLFTIVALAILAITPEPSKLCVVVFPLIIIFPVALNKRRKNLAISFKEALLAYIPFFSSRQLSRLYLSA